MKNIGEKIAIIFLMICWIPFEFIYRRFHNRPSKIAGFLMHWFVTFFARKR